MINLSSDGVTTVRNCQLYLHYAVLRRYHSDINNIIMSLMIRITSLKEKNDVVYDNRPRPTSFIVHKMKS